MQHEPCTVKFTLRAGDLIRSGELRCRGAESWRAAVERMADGRACHGGGEVRFEGDFPGEVVFLVREGKVAQVW